MVFIGAAHNDLMRRYNATRRQHPIQDQPDLASAINADMARMDSIEPLATVVIDSSGLAPAGLRRALLGRLGLDEPQLMPVTVVSFSYRHGVPDDADQIVDMRFARNPHWDHQLRDMTGLDDPVAAFLRADTDAMTVLDHIKATLDIMLGRMQAEGRPQMTLGFGCTGGKHRSVWAAREVAGWLSDKGYKVTIRHRELTDR